MSAPFDPDNPWHAYAEFAFFFHCADCKTSYAFDALSEDQRKRLDLAGLCVALAEFVQSQGWVCLSDVKFLCRDCAAKWLAL